MPIATTVGGYNGEAPDYVMKGVMGLGTSRLIIADAASYAAIPGERRARGGAHQHLLVR